MNIIYYSYMLTVFINFVIIQTRTKWRMDYVMRRLNNIDLQLSDIRTSVKDMSQQEDEFGLKKQIFHHAWLKKQKFQHVMKAYVLSHISQEVVVCLGES